MPGHLPPTPACEVTDEDRVILACLRLLTATPQLPAQVIIGLATAPVTATTWIDPARGCVRLAVLPADRVVSVTPLDAAGNAVADVRWVPWDHALPAGLTRAVLDANTDLCRAHDQTFRNHLRAVNDTGRLVDSHPRPAHRAGATNRRAG